MIDILVPVLSRPQNVRPLLASISAATQTPHRVLFICTASDIHEIAEIEACAAEHLIVSFPASGGDFARKINHGYRASEGDWFFIGADDLVFSHAWDIFCLQTAEPGFSVIGTQDLGNPSVIRGTNATHMLVRRSYIETQGGTIDRTGDVLSESYDHQYVDTEFVETAKTRGQWAFSASSVVEHLHPVWGKSEWDPTYEKAFRRTDRDRALYIRRMRLLRRRVR